MKGGLLLDVVITQGSELLAGEDGMLLIQNEAFDLDLYVVNCIKQLDFEGDGLACQTLDNEKFLPAAEGTVHMF